MCVVDMSIGSDLYETGNWVNWAYPKSECVQHLWIGFIKPVALYNGSPRPLTWRGQWDDAIKVACWFKTVSNPNACLYASGHLSLGSGRPHQTIYINY